MLVNAIVLPSALMTGFTEAPSALPSPARFVLTSVVTPVARSRTNTSLTPRLVSLATRSDAVLLKVT